MILTIIGLFLSCILLLGGVITSEKGMSMIYIAMLLSNISAIYHIITLINK